MFQVDGPALSAGVKGAPPGSAALWRRILCASIGCGLLAATLFGGAGRFAADEEVPLDPAGFTAYVVAKFHGMIPDDKIEVVSPLRLRVHSSRGGWGAYLDRIWDVCRRNRPVCAQAVAGYIHEMSIAFENSSPPRDRSTLRVVVRPSIYVEQMREYKPGSKPLAVPLQGDFWMIGVFDLPTTLEYLNENSVQPLHLTPDEALAVGKQNMAEWVRSHIRDAMANQADGMVINGDPYTSSLFAFPDLWAPLAEKMGGNLLVAVPSANTVIFADGRHPGNAEKIVDVAHRIMQQANRPFSADAFRWTPEGWVVLAAGQTRH